MRTLGLTRRPRPSYNGGMQAQSDSSPTSDSITGKPFATLFVFMFAHFGHHLATAATVPLLPMIRQEFGLDYFQSGLLLSAFSITYGFCQLPMAAFSDRVSKRVVISLGLLGTGVACAGAGLAEGYPLLLLALVLMGVAGSTYHAPASSFLSQAFGKQGRGRSLGLHIVGGTSGLMAAPLLSILIANLTGSWRYAFIFMSVPILLIGVLVWFLARDQEKANIQASAGEKSEPVRLFEIVRLLGVLVAIALLTQLLVSGVNSFLPLFLVDKHGASQEMGGLMLGLVYGAGVIGAPLGGALSDRFGRKPIILLTVLLIGPLILMITQLSFGLAMAAVIAVYGVVIVFRLPAIESLIADLIPAQRRATVLGGYYFLSQETTGIITPLMGWLLDQQGIDNGFRIIAFMGIGCSLLSIAVWKRALR